MRLRYPVQITNGKLDFSRDDKAEKNYSVLATIQGERVYWPYYGNPISLFDPDTLLPSYADLISKGVVKVNGNIEDLSQKDYKLPTTPSV